MHGLRVPSAAFVVFLLPGPLVAQGWFEYVNQVDRFTVNLWGGKASRRARSLGKCCESGFLTPSKGSR